MNKQELLLEILSKQNTRISYLRNDFYNFFIYYFGKHIKYPKLAPFHKEWCKSVQNWLNLYVEWHRESAKTTILGMAYEIFCICYEKKSFICNVCYDKDKAKSFNKLIAQELINNYLLINDFWILYSKKSSDYNDDDISERGINEFVTTNYVKVKAFWMWEAIRWEVFNSKIKWNVRPSLIFFDDIDNNKNTKNINLIKADMDFINWEVIGWIDKSDWQIVWLWNIIRKDWRNPRKKNEVKNNPKWKTFSNFIYWEAWNTNGVIQWERYVESKNEAVDNKISLEDVRKEEWSSFNQNWLWIPILKWQSVVKDEWIRFTSEDIKFDYIQIGVDPAFSLKTWSDAIGIVVTWFKKVWTVLYKYGIYCKKLEWEQKDEDIAEKIIESLYNKYSAVRVLVEKNNWWEIFWRLLQKKELAVDIVNASKDKLSRFKEHEWDLMRWQILFYKECIDLTDELLNFTGDEWWQDNLVDAFVHSLQEYSQKEFYFSIS